MPVLIQILIRLSLVPVSVYYYKRALGICRAFGNLFLTLGGLIAAFQLIYVMLPGTDLFSSVSKLSFAVPVAAVEAVATVLLLWRQSEHGRLEAILFFSLHQLVSVASSLLLFLLSSLLGGEMLSFVVATQWNDLFNRVISAALQAGLLFAIGETAAQLVRKEVPELCIGQFVPAFAAEAASVIILCVLMQESGLFRRMLPALVILMLFYAAADATLLAAFRAYRKNSVLLEELHSLQRMQSLQKEHYLSMNDEMQRASRMRHDYKNMLQTLNLLLASDETEKARQFAASFGELMDPDTVIAYTGNEILDAVLNSKAQAAKRGNIRLIVSLVLPDPFKIRDVDVMSIFSNLLDNAIEYVMELPEEQRGIDVSGEVRAGLWILTFANAFAGERLPDFITTKADAAQHGRGLRIVRAIAEQYGGRFAAKMENGRLVITVILNNVTKESTD